MKPKLGPSLINEAALYLLFGLIAATTGCGPSGNSRSAVGQISSPASSNAPPTFVFGGTGPNALRDGQLLTGVVTIVVAPLSRRQHDIILVVDSELAASALVPDHATNGAALSLDTREFPAGEHLLGVSGFEENDAAELRVRLGSLFGKDVRHLPLPPVKVRFENPRPEPRLKNP